ncbi:hypothetical protein HDV01_006241 [Terramyces sp. JEL0728]|nr:hypothetical protein HDV01_006241 [Terramyces sp. JEL0728]
MIKFIGKMGQSIGIVSGKFTGNNVNLAMIRDTLQERASNLNFSVQKRELQTFGWLCIREVVLEECQRMSNSVADIYMFSNAVMSGNSFLTEENCAEYFQELQVTLRSLETAVLFAAVWIGHMNVNANGRFLNAFLIIIDSLNEMFYILKKSNHFNPEPKQTQYHLDHITTTMARKFMTGVNSLKGKLKNKPMAVNARQPDHIRKKDFKAAAKKFILAVDMFLNIITDADLLLSRRSQYKPMEEIQILQRLFEELYHVSFLYTPPSYPTQGYTPPVNIGVSEYLGQRESTNASTRTLSKSPSRKVSISDKVEYANGPIQFASVRDCIQKIEKQMTVANLSAGDCKDTLFDEPTTILDKSRQVEDPEGLESTETLNQPLV